MDELLLLASIRKTDVVPTPLDMQRIVNAACERLAYVIQEYQAEIVLPPQWPPALGHAAWVEEVWVNGSYRFPGEKGILKALPAFCCDQAGG